MNANPITMSPRLKHIRIVSRLFRLAISLGVIFLLLVGGFALVQSIVVCQGGQIVPGESMTVKMTFSPDQVYVIPTSVQGAAEAPDIPWPVLALAAIQLALTQIMAAIATKRIDTKQAALFFRGLQIAQKNLDYDSPATRLRTVKNVTLTEEGEELAPENRECERPQDCKTCTNHCRRYTPDEDS